MPGLKYGQSVSGFRGRGNRPAGFTLLELLIVLVVIGLSFLLVVPRIADSLANLEFTSAVKKTAGSLRYARNRATAQKTTWTVRIDFEKNSLSLFRKEAESADSSLEESGGEEGKKPEKKEYVLPRGVRWKKVQKGEEEWDSGTAEILFLPMGASSGGRLEMTNDRERTYEITIDFITGTVRLKDISDETS